MKERNHKRGTRRKESSRRQRRGHRRRGAVPTRNLVRREIIDVFRHAIVAWPPCASLLFPCCKPGS